MQEISKCLETRRESGGQNGITHGVDTNATLQNGLSTGERPGQNILHNMVEEPKDETEVREGRGGRQRQRNLEIQDEMLVPVMGEQAN